MKKIGIAIVATNSYFVLGIKFIKRFYHFYKGDDQVTFFFFSDTDPEDYLQSDIDIEYYHDSHSDWVEGTNSKFKNIIKLANKDVDYIYYLDADTSVNQEFDMSNLIGELVGGEHYGNRCWMKDSKPFDRNPASKAYVPEDTDLPQMYYYGAFFGGERDKLIELCKLLREWQIEDRKIPHEPPWNDESYLNKYFHFNEPHVVKTEKFPFLVSDKSGIGYTRSMTLDTSSVREQLKEYKNKLINISGEKVLVDE
jgi:hypothetical protein